MKWLDCFLLAAALGATLFTSYVFAVRPLDRDTIKTAANPSAFQIVVVHESQTCPRARAVKGEELPYHFLITPAAEIVPTSLWRERRPVESPDRFSSAAVHVLFESAPKSARGEQLKALRRLVEELVKRDGLSIRQVFQHSQIDARGCTVMLDGK